MSQRKEGVSQEGRHALRGATVLAQIERFAPLRRLGWAFLLAWVFCVFYTGVVDGYTGSIAANTADIGRRLFFAVLPVSMSVIMLVFIVGFERRLGSPTGHPALFWVAPLATAVSTPLLFWTLPSLVGTEVLFALGSLLTGFGSGFMWVMWGEYYARVTQEDVEFLAPVSAVLAAVLVLMVSSMTGWVALAVVTLFPVLSGLCLMLSWRDVQNHNAAAEYKGAAEQCAAAEAYASAKDGLPRVLAAMGRAGFGILVACLFVCLEGSFWEAPAKDALSIQMVFVASALFVLIVSLTATAGPRRVSLSFLYRWMCPLLVVGFAAVIVFEPGVGTYVAYLVAIAARFAFCLITQMYFARYAVQGAATPVQSYGLGWIFVHVGDLLGVVVLVFVEAGTTAGAFDLAQVAAVSIALLVAATMFVLNDERSFAFGVSVVKSVEDQAGEKAVTQEATKEFGVPETDELTLRIRALAQQGSLTPRETEVFDLLARGRSVPYVRDALVISKETAATHAKHVYAKLDVHSRQELIDLVH